MPQQRNNANRNRIIKQIPESNQIHFHAGTRATSTTEPSDFDAHVHDVRGVNHAPAATGAYVFSPSKWYRGGRGSTLRRKMCFLILRGNARIWYVACLRVGTENTWSSSSSESAFVSGTKRRIKKNPIAL